MSILKGILVIEGSLVTLELEEGYGWTGNSLGSWDDQGKHWCWNISYDPDQLGRQQFDKLLIGRHGGPPTQEIDFQDFLWHYKRYIGGSRQVREYILEFNIWEK